MTPCPLGCRSAQPARAATASPGAGGRPGASSSDTRFTVSAAAFVTAMPALVEPVNDIMSIPGGSPLHHQRRRHHRFTRLNTPAGKPVKSIVSAKTMADSGATSDGFSTTVQPAQMAGTTLRTTWFIGQFQGVISPQTPTGSG